MGERRTIKTFCGVCSNSCAVVATVEDGKLISIKPDAESGFRHDICPGAKGPLTTIGVEAHPERLKHPLKRIGARGEGRWEQISWDEALDIVASKLLELKGKFGPESLVLCLGEPKNMESAFAHRFATTYGTPNVVTPGGLCGEANLSSGVYTYGRATIPDWPEQLAEDTPLPKLFIAWGRDLYHHPGRHMAKIYAEHGVKFVVVDPLRLSAVKEAYMSVRLRPGSDGALAMGLLKVIIEEELYDKYFVARHTVGFDRIRDEVKLFTLDEVERLTWIAKDQVRELARLYATTKPASLEGGNAIDCMTNAFDVHRVFCILRAITGNVNVPGGDVFLTPSPRTRPGSFMLLSKVPRAVDRAIAKEFPVAVRAAYTPFQSLIKANLEGEPYPARAAICCLTNPLLSYPDSVATYEAFLKMDMIVVMELFMTPMAAMADVVLPAAWTWEDDTIGYWWSGSEEVRAYPKVVDPPGEAWTDTKIFNELGKRVGLKEYFWDNDKEALEVMSAGSGMSFREFLGKRKLVGRKEYRGPDQELFRTPSGKAELYSSRLKEQGYDPLPRWEVVSHVPGELTEEYPLVVTNTKSDTYMLTGFKMISSLRKREPDPLVKMNPQTAASLGLTEGDWVYIETRNGRIEQKLTLGPELNPRVVIAAWGWWYPEDGPSTMYGWKRSNYNVLTSYEEIGRPCGSPELRGLPCRVYKVGS